MSRVLAILAFHRVFAKKDNLFSDQMDAVRFNRLLMVLKNFFLILPLSEALSEFNKKTGPKRILSITFDDGYKDNYTVALPILLKHQLRATFFVSSGFLNGQWMWNDAVSKAIMSTQMTQSDLSILKLGCHDLSTPLKRRKILNTLLEKIKYMPLDTRNKLADDLLSMHRVMPPENIMMRKNDVKLLYESGMEIGGHTISHPILSKLTYQAAWEEIIGNKTDLENIISIPIQVFAYPNGRPGDYAKDTIKVLKKAGYRFAVTTTPKVITSISDPFQLPRYTPWDKNSILFALRLGLKMISAQIR